MPYEKTDVSLFALADKTIKDAVEVQQGLESAGFAYVGSAIFTVPFEPAAVWPGGYAGSVGPSRSGGGHIAQAQGANRG